MSSRYRRNFAASLFLFAVRFFFLPHNEVILFAVRFSFCREVNTFAVTVVGHHTNVRQTTSNWIVRILNETTWVVNLSITLALNILILEFVFVVFNTARIGPYCNTKPKSLFLELYYSFGVGAPSIWSCAPKISAVRLKIYTWSHKCSQSQK